MRKFFLFLQMLVASVFLAADEGELPVNFHVVSKEPGIARSGQPTAAQFRNLVGRGYRSVLNLRNFHSDFRKLVNIDLREFRLKLNAGSVTEGDLRDALEIIQSAPKPILIHCWHGSDRTGAVVASCRIVFENWTVERALAEMLEPRYGHHADIYDNLPKLLRAVDWEKMRETLHLRAVLAAEYRPEEVFRVELSGDGLILAGKTVSAPEAVRSANLGCMLKPRLVLAVCREASGPESFRGLLDELLRRPEFSGVPAAVAVPADRLTRGEELLAEHFGLSGRRIERIIPTETAPR